MSLDADEEILQDFLVEAGEILELLSEELVDLEQRPDDLDLLNSIFRGFHTVKGGAGFLQISPLVDCCHYAENVFDILRNQQRQVDAELMDVVLQALDAVNAMFDCVRNNQMPEPADPAIIERLKEFSIPPSATPAPTAEAPVADATAAETPAADSTAPVSEGAESDDITDEEFEQLLDALDEPKKAAEAKKAAPAAAPAGPNDNLITDDEFDALLDELHGKGKGPKVEASKTESTEPKAENSPPAPASAPKGADDNLITESEFEDLLDQLHGNGTPKPAESAQASSSPAKAAPTPEPPKAASPPPAPKPAPKPAAKPGAKAGESSAAEATVRVDTQRLDDIMNMVGELVLVRNRLVRLGGNSNDVSMAKAVANLDVVTGDLQTSVMKTRMQPIKKVFGRFPRVVRDLARSLKKEISLELKGEETDLDKNLVEALADPLVHLVRNSVDHGIEMPDEREAIGKARNGLVVLSAEQEGDHILLSISDDGKGMDPEVLKNRAVQKGVMDQDAADRLSDTEAFNLIFAPGFSTKEEISDISGRGVGMDVVKTKITQLNGTIAIQSKKGEGSRLSIKVPLTLAIMPTLMVMLEDQAFAFPLVSVNEIFHLDLKRTNVVDGQEMIVIREKAIPLFYLKRWLVQGISQTERQAEGHVVVMSVGTQKVGFVVDQLVGQEEVVIKPLGRMLQGTAGMAGATITGDGRIALIIDVPSMLARYARQD